MPFIKKTEILATCLSDHAPLSLEIDFTNFKRGKGFWKMNNSLLADKKYVDMIKTTIKRVTFEYTATDHIPDCTNPLETFSKTHSPESLQTLPLVINLQLFLEPLLMEIRRVTILYSSLKKRERHAKEALLISDLEILQEEMHKGSEREGLTDEYDRKKSELEEIIKYQANGAFVRSRASNKVEGEKPTKYFCSLEKYNAVQKYVPQLIIRDTDNNEKLINDQKLIETEISSFYRNLFQDKDSMIEIDSVEEFLGPQICHSLPKLSETQRSKMEGRITLTEMTNYLKKCKNNVAPGTSGFSNEFFKFFWRDVKVFVINSVDYAFDHGRLSVTQRLGIISIIPKGDKDKRFLSNWRPLTLLNTLYKMISGCIAERIKPVLPLLIHPDQKGFVAGRYIGEVVRTTYDIMHIAKINNIPVLLLTVDFEKAYDSISFRFISKCLKFFNFSEDLIKWVEILLYDFRSVINHCGNISESFHIGRGCRQGDPIASFLFILSIEILAHKLREDGRIEGFCIQTKLQNKTIDLNHLLEIYADDLTIFMKPDSKNLRNAIDTLNSFYKVSGLKISASKTKAVWFGSRHDSNDVLCPDLGLQWVKNFTLLGINFTNNLEGMEGNFSEKVTKLENYLKTGHIDI